MPAPQVAELWAQRTPETFVFDVKAFRVFTQHQEPPRVLPPDIREGLGPLAGKKNVYYGDFPLELMDEMWRRFRLSLEPLRQAGKLGAMLFQFSPWFFYRRSNLAHNRALGPRSWRDIRSPSSSATERGSRTSTGVRCSPLSGSTG